jgi:hypothetical protein
VARRSVCDQETSKNEEAEARYWAVKIQPQWGCNARKTNFQVLIFLKERWF